MNANRLNVADIRSINPEVAKPKAPALLMWDVEGTFIIPGTREKVRFGPQRVSAVSRQQASADLVEVLNSKFSKELRNVPRVAFQQVGFSKNFAMMHLTWTVYVPKQGKAVMAEPAPVQPTEGDKRLDAALEKLTKQRDEETVPVPTDDRNDPPALEPTV